MPSSTHRTRWLALAAGILLSLLFWYWLAPDKPAAEQPVVSPSAATAQQPIQATATPSLTRPVVNTPSSALSPPPFVTGLEQLPASLQGVSVDGEILIDQNRQLVITRGLRSLFDFFLSANSEEPVSQLRQRIMAYIRHRTPEPAAGQAIALLDRYLAYLTAATQIRTAGGRQAEQLDLKAVELQKQQEQGLRRQYLDAATIAAFFGDEDAYDQYTLQALAIERDSTINPEQKAIRIQQLQQQLPADLQQTLTRNQNFIALQEQTALLRQQGASPETIQALRTRLVGAEAAQRLAVLDQQRAQLQQRVSQYLFQRQQIMGNPALSDAQRQQQIMQLQQQQFSPAEQLRLPALERMQQAAS